VSSASWIILITGLCLPVVAFFVYIYVKYAPKICRIFEEKPLFLPLRVAPTTDDENVRFATRDGLMLAGTYFANRAGRRLGVIVFSHEFLGDRWSVLPYLDHLRELGFDLFSFDYRNHGQSDPDPNYQPLQWVTDHEVNDLRAALVYVRSRPDADLAGVGLFGVSRGGGTALCVASKDARVWGVATDGAFPTNGTMLAYIKRWSEIYVPSNTVWQNMPKQVYSFLAWTARRRSQRRLSCRYPMVETAVARLAPRPLFMIHGAKDTYIGPAIAKKLFRLAGNPKELWLVPKAKHNRCREIAGRAYYDRLADFFLANAPRVQSPTPHASVRSDGEPSTVEPVTSPSVLSTSAIGANVHSH
jgi:pimeloyl-ACP methyl ester carboxylesterase